ncbi:S1 family peptidase [Victivallis vadensis]|uniref:S1 family peptidase n=1 Tax=Victivallis vadensis TaxID=172901 RepID=UPI00307E0749
MSGILLLLLAFSIGGSLCAGTPPENGGDSLFSQLTRGETNPGRHAARRNGNMLIIPTDKGAGSGFIVNKWNRPVIVSNAHVYLTGRNPRVFDVNDREYEIKEVIASKSRDLVFLVFEPFPGETAKPLEVEEDVSALEPDTRLTAYGNSLAGNVIRRSDGVLQAVGPQTIETTVPFVTGNSGGPLVTTDGGKVVGVATYMIRIRDDWTKQGSGFEQKKWWKPVVRRFATRIDNIDVSDLEQIDMRKIAECDLTMCERAQEVTRQLKEANNSQDFAAILFGNLSLIAEGRSFAWNSSYLKKQFAEDTELFTAITERLELGDLLELLDPLALLYQNASEVTYARIQPAKTKCFFCSGYGQITKHVPRPGYDPNSGESSLITKKIPCVVCRQTGKRAISPPRNHDAGPGGSDPVTRGPGSACADHVSGFHARHNQQGVLSVLSVLPEHPGDPAAPSRSVRRGDHLQRQPQGSRHKSDQPDFHVRKTCGNTPFPEPRRRCPGRAAQAVYLPAAAGRISSAGRRPVPERPSRHSLRPFRQGRAGYQTRFGRFAAVVFP